MIVAWHTPLKMGALAARPSGRVGATGLTPEQNYHAKGMLIAWNTWIKEIFTNYGQESDLTDWSVWSFRDARMLADFVIWWNNSANEPRAQWGQEGLPNPTLQSGVPESNLMPQHLHALDVWGANSGVGLPSCLEVCLATEFGGMDASIQNRANCSAQCQNKPLPYPPLPPAPPPTPAPGPTPGPTPITCPAGTLLNPVSGLCEAIPPLPPAPPPIPGPTPPPTTPTTTASTSGISPIAFVVVAGIIGIVAIAAAATRGGGNPFRAERPRR